MRYPLLAALGILLLQACNAAEAGAGGASAPPPTPVSAATPLVEDAVEWSEFTGHTEAVATVELRARVSGYLTRVGFVEGDVVEKGALLYALDARPYEADLARAEGELARAGANVSFAEREVGRAERLIAAQAIAERERDSTQSTLDRERAATKVAQAAVASARLNIEYSRLVAPIRGRIGRTSVTPGNLVQANGAEPLTTIVSIDPIYVYVDVDEARALRLSTEGASAKVWVGVADEGGYPHEGTLDWIDNHAQAGSGTVRARAVIANPDGKLRPGMFARLRLPRDRIERAVLVDDRAVGTDQDRKFVYVIEGDKVAYRAVDLGGKFEGLRIVRDGLTASDRVVVSGLQRVRPGMTVAARDVAMKEEGSAQ
ncbi:MAG: efflux RND transporter periplasmic adaptor subunit [Myxococcota bacterium]